MTLDFSKYKPMLADNESADVDSLQYPVMCSVKLDGIRAEYINNELKSRSLKKIPNLYINKELQTILTSGTSNFSGQILDGELISGTNFQECSGNIMREEGEPAFIYYIFDYLTDNITEAYQKRMEKLKQITFNIANSKVKIVKVLPVMCNTKEELLTFEKKCLDEGHEGIMIRSCDGPYKYGRTTTREGYLLKLKRFTDSECVITGFEELETNNNVKTINELGYSKRASNKANKVGAGTLGTIVGKDLVTGNIIRLGTGKGLTKQLRQEMWDTPEDYIGKIAKYKHFEKTGVKIGRRIPVFLGMRSEIDMGE